MNSASISITYRRSGPSTAHLVVPWTGADITNFRDPHRRMGGVLTENCCKQCVVKYRPATKDYELKAALILNYTLGVRKFGEPRRRNCYTS